MNTRLLNAAAVIVGLLASFGVPSYANAITFGFSTQPLPGSGRISVVGGNAVGTDIPIGDISLSGHHLQVFGGGLDFDTSSGLMFLSGIFFYLPPHSDAGLTLSFQLVGLIDSFSIETPADSTVTVRLSGIVDNFRIKSVSDPSESNLLPTLFGLPPDAVGTFSSTSGSLPQSPFRYITGTGATFTFVPEPSSVLLSGGGLLAIGWLARKKHRRARSKRGTA